MTTERKSIDVLPLERMRRRLKRHIASVKTWVLENLWSGRWVAYGEPKSPPSSWKRRQIDYVTINANAHCNSNNTDNDYAAWQIYVYFRGRNDNCHLDYIRELDPPHENCRE